MNLYDKAYGPGNFTVAVTDSEGGQWIPFSEWQKWSDNNKVHSIAFSDGSIWDAFNGWRKPRYDGSTIDAEGWAEAAFDKPQQSRYPAELQQFRGQDAAYGPYGLHGLRQALSNPDWR